MKMIIGGRIVEASDDMALFLSLLDSKEAVEKRESRKSRK